jgi:hypothetical protein
MRVTRGSLVSLWNCSYSARSAPSLLRVDVHRAKLRRAERFSVLSEPVLEEQCGTGRVETNGEPQEEHDRQEEEPADRREHQIHDTFGEARTRQEELLAHLEPQHPADVLGGHAHASKPEEVWDDEQMGKHSPDPLHQVDQTLRGHAWHGHDRVANAKPLREHRSKSEVAHHRYAFDLGKHSARCWRRHDELRSRRRCGGRWRRIAIGNARPGPSNVLHEVGHLHAHRLR